MMTEKEKMLTGFAYKAFDRELLCDRQETKEQVFEFNALKPSALKKRNEIIIDLFGEEKGSFFIEPPFRCDYGYNIEIGENFYSNYNLVILDGARVSIGDNVLIGPNVGIYTATHPIDSELRSLGDEYAFPIIIEDNVWIGGHVVINPGVTIGANSVIGSGSVVTKDVPKGTVAAGNPCRVIRRIGKEDTLRDETISL